MESNPEKEEEEDFEKSFPSLMLSLYLTLEYHIMQVLHNGRKKMKTHLILPPMELARHSHYCSAYRATAEKSQSVVIIMKLIQT